MEGMSGTMHPVNPRKGHDVAPCRHLLAVGGNTPCGGSFLRKSNMLLIIPYLHLLFFYFDFSVVHFFSLSPVLVLRPSLSSQVSPSVAVLSLMLPCCLQFFGMFLFGGGVVSIVIIPVVCGISMK